ncbi:dihydroorotate dehydrogenase B (NAD(+)), catalytic subunit [Dissulfurispira thermophila]|uniref:Dihydroorotate dehydrogenase n=2 Tax=root TaxID=1 RepID=A0A7G1H1C9_9BACT|nr:dihydroorotate dehydrogenase [Dissulfurispira thermophila]BCB96418.1 dihydroorotate dehydrogenase B (NAD(+)), catalytic subunit [Dissulfurispira thermophila]
MGSGGINNINIEVDIAGLKLKNPVMTASGTFGYGEEYSEFLDLNMLGAIVVKGLSITPRQGNPTPRIVETPAGMLNAIGLQNIGVRTFIEEKLPFLRHFKTPVIANFFGDSIDEYVQAAQELSSADGIHGLEMNISCPNKQAGWIVFGTDPVTMRQVVTAVRKATSLPLIVKLSPNVADISLMARIAEDSGADAVSLINTMTGMVIDIKKRRPVLANKTGGLSGPAIRPIAVRMVWEVYKAVKIPIIGMGGIMNTSDALEFLIAGARAVAIGTANFINPTATIEIIEGLEKFMIEERLSDINEIIGSLKTD